MSHRRQWTLLALALVMIQLWGHVVNHRPSGLILDDWSNYQAAGTFASPAALLAQTLSHGTRPLSMSVNWLAFRFLGDHIQAYFALSIGAQLVLLLLVAAIARQLGASLAATFLAGLFVALLPTVSELYFWPTLILSGTALALPLYLGSAAAWLAYARTRKPAWLALSLASYGLGVFSYEIGVFLPLAYLCAPRRETWRQRVIPLSAFVPVLLGYAAWRLTDAFGFGETYLPPHMQGGLPLADLVWNLKEFARWWLGGHMGATILNGWYGFAALPAATQAVLVAGNLAVAGFAVRAWLLLARPTGESRSDRGRLAAWAVLWLVASCLPLALAYTAGRLMYLPACGLAWLLAALVPTRFYRLLAGPLALATAALLTVNQGTARQWQESGRRQQRLYEHVRASRPEWQDMEIVLFDTQGLHAPGPANRPPPPVQRGLPFCYGNACLLRGFAPDAMLKLAGRPGDRPRALLDAEHWPESHAGQLVWHGRYDRSVTHFTPLSQVFRIDVAAVTAR